MSKLQISTKQRTPHRESATWHHFLSNGPFNSFSLLFLKKLLPFSCSSSSISSSLLLLFLFYFFFPCFSCRSANKCLAKVAHMCAQLQQFQKAAITFEDVRFSTCVWHSHIPTLPHEMSFLMQIGKGCLDVGLLKYSAKDYFFKALVCWFCNNRQGVEVSFPTERDKENRGEKGGREREREGEKRVAGLRVEGLGFRV